jgi:tRNA dimethylallyltransferase
MATRGVPERKVIALAGPTASGKTAASIALARQLDAEIISVDSALVYRGMDIGTAKPTLEERGGIAHHLIDIRDPLQAYSAAEFAADVARLVPEIHARGHSVLLVGGTMLYFKALFQGLDAMPPADPAVRAGLDARAAREGWTALHAELARVDPATAARLAPGDTQRIQRALEVWMVSGQPMSSFHTRGDASQRSPFADTPLFCLEPADRAWLHERIALRFDAMLAQGFLEEVKALRARGDLTPELPSMRCVGYRQAWEMLDGMFPFDQLRERGIAATRQLAKRQLTWLRAMPRRHVIACDAPNALEALIRAVEDQA